MPNYLNYVAINAARNGTTAHNTINPASSGTVVAGSAFTPTAGNFLLVVAEGSVTSTTPSGFTLPTSGSSVGFTGLYVWYDTSASGSDTVSTTHNASNYPCTFHFIEYPSGTTFSASATATAVSLAGGAGPTVSGLTGTNDQMGAVGVAVDGTTGTVAIAWSAGTEVVDTFMLMSGTEGHAYGLTIIESSAASSGSSAATVTEPSGNPISAVITAERLMFAVKPPAVAAFVRPKVQVLSQAVRRASRW